MPSIAPRPPINQGIDNNNAVVLRHTAIYNGALATITEGMQTVGLMVDPYGTAPLSGYLGIWSPTSNPIRVQLTNDIGAIPVDYSYTPEPGANLVPLLGLVPAALNHLTVTIPGVGTASSEIITAPLPPTDAELPLPPPPDDPTVIQEPPRYTGFPLYEVTIPNTSLPDVLDEIYFISFNRRFNIGFDPAGEVRWYTSLDIPSTAFTPLDNGHFLTTSLDADDFLQLYEVDMIGRVHTVYILDNTAHHSLLQLPDRNIIFPSEYTGETSEDGVSIIDINTGLEIAYYDMRNVLDLTRPFIPRVPDARDWLHLNQAYINATNNLVVMSGRNQSSVVAVDATSSDLVFILGSHRDWADNFQQYLLTPVDDTGAEIYDLSNPDDIALADNEFWNWGQHACVEVPNSTVGIVEFLVFDNANWRARSEALAVPPNDNASRMLHFRVDINAKTVTKLYEYGRTEVGNRGYSSYVCNAFEASNGNYVVNFGGHVFDENGRSLTHYPGYSDIADPLIGDTAQGQVILQEIIPSTKTPIFEMSFRSGLFKTPEGAGPFYTVDLYCFRACKLPLIPSAGL